MKTLDVGQVDLPNCVSVARTEPIMLTQGGEPVALLVGVEGLDKEQIELGISSEFWRFIQGRRQQATLTKDELLKQITN
jgi:hypothetical protein